LVRNSYVRTGGQTLPRIITARLSAKAQTVIPKPIRDRLGVGPGDVILFEVRDDEVVLRPLRRTVGDDPFAVFHEWSSAADEDACRDL
jgi:antitoxin PrlF